MLRKEERTKEGREREGEGDKTKTKGQRKEKKRRGRVVESWWKFMTLEGEGF